MTVSDMSEVNKMKCSLCGEEHDLVNCPMINKVEEDPYLDNSILEKKKSLNLQDRISLGPLFKPANVCTACGMQGHVALDCKKEYIQQGFCAGETPQALQAQTPQVRTPYTPFLALRNAVQNDYDSRGVQMPENIRDAFHSLEVELADTIVQNMRSLIVEAADPSEISKYIKHKKISMKNS